MPKVKSKITYTAIANIDFDANKVIDESQIKQETFDAYNDTFKVWHKDKPDEQRTITLINVSLYDDVLIINGEPSKILHMLTTHD